MQRKKEQARTIVETLEAYDHVSPEQLLADIQAPLLSLANDPQATHQAILFIQSLVNQCFIIELNQLGELLKNCITALCAHRPPEEHLIILCKALLERFDYSCASPTTDLERHYNTHAETFLQSNLLPTHIKLSLLTHFFLHPIYSNSELAQIALLLQQIQNPQAKALTTLFRIFIDYNSANLIDYATLNCQIFSEKCQYGEEKWEPHEPLPNELQMARYQPILIQADMQADIQADNRDFVEHAIQTKKAVTIVAAQFNMSTLQFDRLMDTVQKLSATGLKWDKYPDQLTLIAKLITINRLGALPNKTQTRPTTINNHIAFLVEHSPNPLSRVALFSEHHLEMGFEPNPHLLFEIAFSMPSNFERWADFFEAHNDVDPEIFFNICPKILRAMLHNPNYAQVIFSLIQKNLDAFRIVWSNRKITPPDIRPKGYKLFIVLALFLKYDKKKFDLLCTLPELTQLKLSFSYVLLFSADFIRFLLNPIARKKYFPNTKDNHLPSTMEIADAFLNMEGIRKKTYLALTFDQMNLTLRCNLLNTQIKLYRLQHGSDPLALNTGKNDFYIKRPINKLKTRGYPWRFLLQNPEVMKLLPPTRIKELHKFWPGTDHSFHKSLLLIHPRNYLALFKTESQTKAAQSIKDLIMHKRNSLENHILFGSENALLMMRLPQGFSPLELIRTHFYQSLLNYLSPISSDKYSGCSHILRNLSIVCQHLASSQLHQLTNMNAHGNNVLFFFCSLPTVLLADLYRSTYFEPKKVQHWVTQYDVAWKLIKLNLNSIINYIESHPHNTLTSLFTALEKLEVRAMIDPSLGLLYHIGKGYRRDADAFFSLTKMLETKIIPQQPELTLLELILRIKKKNDINAALRQLSNHKTTREWFTESNMANTISNLLYVFNAISLTRCRTQKDTHNKDIARKKPRTTLTPGKTPKKPSTAQMAQMAPMPPAKKKAKSSYHQVLQTAEDISHGHQTNEETQTLVQHPVPNSLITNGSIEPETEGHKPSQPSTLNTMTTLLADSLPNSDQFFFFMPIDEEIRFVDDLYNISDLTAELSYKDNPNNPQH